MLASRIGNFLKSITAPEKFLVLVLLVFGSVACLGLPISAGYDEETHFVRVWEMAHLIWVPNEQLGNKLPFPAIYWELSYRRQPLVEAAEPDLWSKYGGLRMDAHDYIYSNVVTRSVYSPVLLLPQAFVLRYLGLSLQFPALTVYYACRFAGLLTYLLLCWLALRSMPPWGKWLLAVLMVSPMALFQASSISADTISNGIGFLFIGASLALAGKNEIASGGVPGNAHPRNDVGWREWWLLVGLIALLFVAKVNLLFLVLLPFLLIGPRRFKMKGGYALLAGAAALLLVVEVAGWNVAAYSHFTRMLEGASPRDQVRYILSAPLGFARILLGDLWSNGLAYLQGWVGVYGYNYWPVPGLTYLLYPLAVVAAMVGGRGTIQRRSEVQIPLGDAPADDASVPDRRTRYILLGLFVIGVLMTVAALYVAMTPVGSQYVAGVQGRYFTPVMPLLLLGLVGLLPLGRATARPYGVMAAWLGAAALVLYTGGLMLSYHVPCGSEYYQPGLCYQPEYKNWAPEAASSPAVSTGTVLSQEIVPACNGMKQLRMWVNSAGSDEAGSTLFVLHSTQGSTDVARKTVSNASIHAGEWVTLDFGPQWHSQNTLYLLDVSSASPEGIKLGTSLRGEYFAGKLLVNGKAISQDLLFQYGCLAGMERVLEELR